MITAQDLAAVTIRRVIFHDVPNNQRGSARQPTLSEVESRLDAMRGGHLKTLLTRVLSSKSAYPMVFSAGTQSPVPPRIRAYTAGTRLPNEFVAASQDMANYLCDQQRGSVS